MTRILDKLEEEGLVRRVYLEADRRRVDVHLTRRGAELAEASFAALYAAESAVLASLGKRRREAIATSLDALLDVFAARTAGGRDLL
jgi:DNA-binding MarR family transcriptional regulator